MTLDTPFEEEITDEETFDALLAQCIEAAERNDVDIEGTREYREGPGDEGLEVMFLALSADDAPE